MAELSRDQADGLRRMFRGECVRIVHIVAGRAAVGRSTLAANLACALARAGRATLLADCVDDGSGAAAAAHLGLAAPLGHVHAGALRGIVAGPDGLGVVTLPACALRSGRNDVGTRSALSMALVDYAADLDFLLVSSRSSLALESLRSDGARREVVVVLSRAASSITQAYALVKSLSSLGVARRFRVLVNRVASTAEAGLIFRNMAAVAQGYLDVELDLLGFVPADDALERASRAGRSVIECAPKSASAQALRRLAHDIAAAGLDHRRQAAAHCPLGARVRVA